MSARNFSATAQQTTLSGAINNSTTSVPVSATTGFPAAPFIIAVDAGGASQEVMLVTAVAGLTLTVTRGYDSTTAVAHDTGAVVQHSHSAIDFREANTHIQAASGVHGVAGSLVGTSDAQTLSNKDLSSGTNVFPSSLATDAEVTSAITTERTAAATLTNKTLALGSNTVSGTKAQFNAAMTDDDFATLTGAEALSNKTIDAASTIGGISGTTIAADHAAWSTFAPTYSGFALGNGTAAWRYKQVGKTVHVKGSVKFGSTSTFSAAFSITLPVAAEMSVETVGGNGDVPLGAALALDSSAAARYAGIPYALLSAGTSFAFMDMSGTGLNWGGTGGANVPFNWATNDVLSVSFTYEAA